MTLGKVGAEVKKWQIEISGKEIIDNRAMVKKDGRTIKVYGTASVSYALGALVSIQKVKDRWVYDRGKITKAKITGHDLKYKPPGIYKIKRFYCSNTAVVARFAGRSIGGLLTSADTLKLTWPIPTGFKQPAVEAVSVSGGKEKQACFASMWFMDYCSSYEIQLKDRWSHRFEHTFGGALEKAKVIYQFKVRSSR